MFRSIFRSSLTHILLAVIVVITGFSATMSQPAEARNSSGPVLAYYYGWWNETNWHSTSDLPPTLYDSWSDDVMRRHIRQARNVGITGFICTWEYTCERLLDIAEEEGGFSVAFSVDPAAEHKLNSWDGLVNGMNRMKEKTNSPAYLRWNGKPVFVFWNNTILPGSSSVSDFRRLRDTIDPGRNQFWLGGGTDFSYLDIFDAIHYFDIAWESSQGAAMASYNRNLSNYNASRGTNKPFVATVMPGYDDIAIRNGYRRSRENGNYYRASWDTAFNYNADAVIITSWNEWYEGSQIEPSRTYGDLYLDITRQRTARFRVQPGNFDHPAFERTWQREDRAVAEGRVNRTWTWGYARREQVFETYGGGQRRVQYTDKARMEINDPNADQNALWYVTNGLLAKELMTGRMQVGDNEHQQREPAAVNVAGDMSDSSGPTYATFNTLRDRPATPIGWHLIQRVDRNGNVTEDPNLKNYDVKSNYYIPQTDHAIASVFWSFMNQQGLIYRNGNWTNDRLFADPFYAVGYPITEPYWTNVRVAGEAQDVLVQCFERRCLTYTPGNPAGWKVEMGNVGQHYHRWRYGWSW